MGGVTPARELIAAPLIVSAEVSGAEWDAFVQRHTSGTVEHLWFWRDLFARVFHHDCVYLAARRDDVIVGVLPLVRIKSRLVGRVVVSLPFANYAGLLVVDHDAARALVQRAREIGQAFGASYVELRNTDRHVSELPYRQQKVGARLQLPSNPGTLWAALDRKVRNQVRKAQKEGLTVERGNVALVDEFYTVFAHNMRDLGTPVFPKRLFVETVEQMRGGGCVFIVRKDAQAVGGGIALGWRDTVLVPWASSLRAYRPFCPNMLLYWSMLEWAVSSGYQVFDLGRSTPGAGTHHFKQQWHPDEFPLHWEYVLLGRSDPPKHGPDQPAFKVAVEMWKRLPLWITTRLGPGIVRHIS